MNAFDHAVLLQASRLVAALPGLAEFASLLSGLDLIKGEAFMAAFWWIWFSRKGSTREAREILVATFAASLAAIVLGRGLAHLLPFRRRPMFVAELGFHPPARELAGGGMRFWSSFPSDHAMLFSALATGFWRLSPPLSAAAHVYWIAVVALPRVYLGLHYPTDVIGGAAIGAAAAWAATGPMSRRRIARAPLAWAEDRPGFFYAALFMAALQVGTMFGEPRALVAAARRALKPSQAIEAEAP